jgi:uncharacterized protein (TIGR03067 family)
LALVASAVLAQPPAPDKAARTDREIREIEDRVYGCWKEVRYERNGKVIEIPGQLDGHKFSTNDYHSWARGGELVLPRGDPATEAKTKVIVNAKTDPIRLDIWSEWKGKQSVSPGIVKFEKDKMIWVQAGVEQPTEKFREDGGYKTRPTGFDATKTNHYVKRVLVPCKYLEH